MARSILVRPWFWLGIAFVIGIAGYVLLLWPLRNPHPSTQPSHGVLAIRDVKIYPSPDHPPIEHGAILVRDGVIVSVGANGPVPADAQVLSCERCTVTAGFWNAHVHFTEGKWNVAPFGGTADLNAQLVDMLTSRGFTTVVDAGSDLRNTISLRRRIESGDLLGPKIYTAGDGLYPPNGVPYYLKDAMPFFLIWLMPQPATPEEAARIEERNIAKGADLLKLFTGSYVARGKVLPMPVPIVKAAVDVAHRHGQLAYSHPSDLAGTKAAIEGGVDVLAHAPDTTDGIDAALLGSMVTRHLAVIPTLKMFATTVTTSPGYLKPIYAVVRQFHALGGELIFGTDVGYMTDYRTDDEFRALAECGLNAKDVLRMLTTNPAARFGESADIGTVAPGKMADLVVLDGDPEHDITAFAHVRFTIRNGRLLYGQ